MSTQPERRPESLDAVIENVVDIAALWARYGLNAGRAALEASAKTLNNTAEILSDLSKRFEHDKPAR